MASLGLSGTSVVTFQAGPVKTGLDLVASKSFFTPGTFSCDPSATIRAGQLVALDSSGRLILSTGANVVGVARFNKMTLGKAVNVNEAIVLTGTDVINLKRANVSNVSVRATADVSAAAFVGAGTDYTANTTNGTIARVGSGAITDGETVYVTYTFDLTEADYKFIGKNFWQTNDVATINEGRMAIIMGPALIYTTEYDTSRTYATTGASSTLYSGATGLFTNASGQEHVGKCIQIPTADYPFLGIRLNAQAIVI